MAAVSCFYKTPAQAQKIGLKVTRNEVVSSSEAVKLRDAYAKAATDQKAFVSVATTVLGGAIKNAGVMMFGVSIGSTLATSYGKTYMDQLASIYDAIATTGNNFNKVKLIYEYRRKGSNDGAYWLIDVKFLK